MRKVSFDEFTNKLRKDERLRRLRLQMRRAPKSRPRDPEELLALMLLDASRKRRYLESGALVKLRPRSYRYVGPMA